MNKTHVHSLLIVTALFSSTAKSEADREEVVIAHYPFYEVSEAHCTLASLVKSFDARQSMHSKN